MRYHAGKLLVAAGLLLTAVVPAACGSDDSSPTTSSASASTAAEATSSTGAAGDNQESSTTAAPPTSSPGGEDFDTCMEDEPADLGLADTYAIEDGNFSEVSEEGLQAYMTATIEYDLLTTEVDVTEEDKDCMSTAWENTIATTDDLAVVAQAFASADTASEEANEFVERWSGEVSVTCPEVTEQEMEAILNP